MIDQLTFFIMPRFTLITYFSLGLLYCTWIDPDLLEEVQRIYDHPVPFPNLTICTPYSQFLDLAKLDSNYILRKTGLIQTSNFTTMNSDDIW